MQMIIIKASDLNSSAHNGHQPINQDTFNSYYASEANTAAGTLLGVKKTTQRWTCQCGAF